MKSTLAWLALALLALGQVKQTQTTQDRNLIVGAWSLNSNFALSLQERSRHRLDHTLWVESSMRRTAKCRRN